MRSSDSKSSGSGARSVSSRPVGLEDQVTLPEVPRGGGELHAYNAVSEQEQGQADEEPSVGAKISEERDIDGSTRGGPGEQREAEKRDPAESHQHGYAALEPEAGFVRQSDPAQDRLKLPFVEIGGLGHAAK